MPVQAQPLPASPAVGCEVRPFGVAWGDVARALPWEQRPPCPAMATHVVFGPEWPEMNMCRTHAGNLVADL